jgi:hypothetical protein
MQFVLNLVSKDGIRYLSRIMQKKRGEVKGQFTLKKFNPFI